MQHSSLRLGLCALLASGILFCESAAEAQAGFAGVEVHDLMRQALESERRELSPGSAARSVEAPEAPEVPEVEVVPPSRPLTPEEARRLRRRRALIVLGVVGAVTAGIVALTYVLPDPEFSPPSRPPYEAGPYEEESRPRPNALGLLYLLGLLGS